MIVYLIDLFLYLYFLDRQNMFVRYCNLAHGVAYEICQPYKRAEQYC